MVFRHVLFNMGVGQQAFDVSKANSEIERLGSFLPAIQATGLGLLPRWDFHPLFMPAFAGRTLFLYCSSAFTRASRASFSPELPSFTRPTSISRSRTLKLDKFPISISAPFMASHRGLGLHAVSPSGDTDRSGVVIVLADLASTRS